MISSFDFLFILFIINLAAIRIIIPLFDFGSFFGVIISVERLAFDYFTFPARTASA